MHDAQLISSSQSVADEIVKTHCGLVETHQVTKVGADRVGAHAEQRISDTHTYTFTKNEENEFAERTVRCWKHVGFF